MTGTVNIARGIWHDTAFKAEPFTEREAFMWMVMEASYLPREKRVGSVVVHTERGQLATSIRFMSEAWGWSKSRVDRFLKRLENRDMIGTESGTGVNVITVCKYDDYQGAPGGGGTPKSEKRDSSGTAAGQQRDKPNKGLTKGATQETQETDVSCGGARRRARKPEVPIPEGWIPSQKNIDDAHERNFSDQEIEDEARRFRDHHLAKGSLFRDWDAAWRTWLGNARRFAPRVVAGREATGTGGRRSSLASIVARRRAQGYYDGRGD